jgi:hypothetical protein
MTPLNIDAYAVAITTNMNDHKIYVLSTQSDSIVFPLVEVDNTNIEQIDDYMVDYMRKFLMTNPIELSPQIIKLHSTFIKPRTTNTINTVYGFLVKEGIKNFDSYWINFDYQNPNTEYVNLIFEVMQKLK